MTILTFHHFEDSYLLFTKKNGDVFQSSHVPISRWCKSYTPPFLTDETVVVKLRASDARPFPMAIPDDQRSLAEAGAPFGVLGEYRDIAIAEESQCQHEDVEIFQHECSEWWFFYSVSWFEVCVCGWNDVMWFLAAFGCWTFDETLCSLPNFQDWNKLRNPQTFWRERAHVISIWWKKKTSKRVIKHAFHIIAGFLSMRFYGPMSWQHS